MARPDRIDSASCGKPTRPERCVAEAEASWLPASGRFVGTMHRLDALVGEGGVSRVYAAWDFALSRRVAIKMLRPELAAREDLRAALVAEARALAAIRHPRIVTVHGCDTHRGEPFVILELVDGADLGARLREGLLPLGLVCRVLAQIAEGVAALHARGTTHGDLKPSNVLLDGDGHVTLIDLGGVASGHGVEGTPAYMSPERLDRGAPSVRDDVFAFATTAHEMLTGELPRERRSIVCARRPGMSRHVDALISLSLSESASERPASIEAFADELVRALRT